MTLQTLVRSHYKEPEELAMAYGTYSKENGFEDSGKLQVVMGHFRFGYHKFNERKAEYSAFLRNPIDHLISNFNFTFDFPEKYPNLLGTNKDIITFANGPYGYNFQTRFVSGIDDIKGREEEVLEIAKSNLKNHFACIGFTEDFDTSLYMLAQHLGWSKFYYQTKNRGKTRAKQDRPTAEITKKLKEINRYDEDLYQFAQELYQQQKKLYPSIDQKVKMFQLKNKWFWKFNPTYTKLKVLLGLANK